jgi:hypothetical protein
MKALLFILLATAAYGQSSNYALINGDGTVIEVFVATPEVAAGYPAVAQSAFPDAVKCVPALGAGMGWHYDSTTNTFTASLAETIVDVSKAPPAFTLQDPTPVITTNNAVALPVVTTNNISILTTNNSQ